MTIPSLETGYVIGLSLLADGVPLIGVMGDLAIPLVPLSALGEWIEWMNLRYPLVI
jgi:hypothetical protein